MDPSQLPLRGRLERHVVHSPALEGNFLNDPADRPVWVYLPPGYDCESTRRWPCVYVIQGYTGQVEMWANSVPWRPTYLETADRVMAGAGNQAALVIFVDAWTAYGGSQYVDSPGTGNYHTYLCEDLVGWVDANYRTIEDPASRAISGKSSGGFGSMITPMLRPDLFGLLATHAGDTLYEHSYIPDIAPTVRALRAFDGDPHAWWEDFRNRPALSRSSDAVVIGLYGCAGCFSPGPDRRPALPFDTTTGVLNQELWAKWLAWDPVRMVPHYRDAVRSWRAVWIDAGTSDEYNLDVGATAFREALREAGVPDQRVRFELFDGGHAGIDFRYPLALDWLTGQLAH